MTILNLKKTNKNYDYVLPLRILSESQYRCIGTLAKTGLLYPKNAGA